MGAVAVIVTVGSEADIDEIVSHVRTLRTDILIISRARDAAHARHLYTIGVTDAVPETIEASLQLSEATLIRLGLGTGLVIASIHEKRDEFRRELQQAAGQAGLETTRLFGQQCHIAMGGQRLHHVTVAIALDQINGVTTDRTGRAQNGDLAPSGGRLNFLNRTHINSLPPVKLPADRGLKQRHKNPRKNQSVDAIENPSMPGD